MDDAGERSFAFYRNPGADTRLTPEEAIQALEGYGEKPRFLHFGSVSLTAEPARSATLAAARRARELGILLSYDPNYRPSLWPEPQTALARMKEPLPLCQVLKLAEEELALLTGQMCIRDRYGALGAGMKLGTSLRLAVALGVGRPLRPVLAAVSGYGLLIFGILQLPISLIYVVLLGFTLPCLLANFFLRTLLRRYCPDPEPTDQGPESD